MMNPEFKLFKILAARHHLVPTFKTFAADLDTPVTVYLKVANANPYNALLESVEGGEKFGRYSFISVSHHLRFECKNSEVRIFSKERNEKYVSQNPLLELRKIMQSLNPATLPDLPRFCGGAVGMLGYDAARYFEKLPDQLPDDLKIPDAVFLFTDECVIFDHWKHQMILVKWNKIKAKSESALKQVYQNSEKALNQLAQKIRNGKAALPLNGKNQGQAKSFKSNLTPAQYGQGVARIKEYIRAGDVIQTVFSQRFEIQSRSHPVQLYRALRLVNPSPYLYCLRMNDFSIVGSSPEILVRKEGRTATTLPIAGTRRRGKDAAKDLRLEKELHSDPKERAEHLMLVDLGRNDLGRCCKPGSVRVSEFMKVEKYSHVMHLVSSVQGQLNAGQDSFSLLQACFPAGTVSGAPKIRAMEIIDELEQCRRNIYAGSIGYFSYADDMDMAITIRTMLVKNNRVYVQAGAGIVADSVPQYEEQESRSKAAALFKAVELADKGL